MADTEFKNKNITFPENWVRNSNGGVIGQDMYKPDMSFSDSSGKVRCIIESTSTGDRKVGVGELCLADKFFSDNETEGVLIFSMCGISKSSPTPNTQSEYLKPYFKHLKRTGILYGVRDIYFIFERDFELLNWVALNDEFKEKALRLVASDF